MSQRRNVEEAFARYLLARQGLACHWQGRGELVATDLGGHPFPQGQAACDEAWVMARELYEVFLARLDGNRMALEILGAYGNLGGDDFGMDAMRDASRAGEAVKLVLATRGTFPEDYTVPLARVNQGETPQGTADHRPQSGTGRTGEAHR